MRIHILINNQAGQSNEVDLRAALSQALFRCEVTFTVPQNRKDFESSVDLAIQDQVDRLVICGGDGTVNCALKPLIEAKKHNIKIPNIAVLRSGTANDLGNEMSISKKLNLAARTILSDDKRVVDILEVQSGGQSRYMITNGGIGIPAHSAQDANRIRFWLKDCIQDNRIPYFLRYFADIGLKLIKSQGDNIYKLSLILNLIKSYPHDWKIHITNSKFDFITEAPYIMVSNQRALGGGFVSAPFTSNGDGFFNVIVFSPKNRYEEIQALWNILQEELPNQSSFQSFETHHLNLKAKGECKMTFFGDGEILFKEVKEIEIRCHSPGIELIVPKIGE